MKNQKHFYEKIVFPQQTPHWLFAMLVSVIGFFISQLFIAIDKQSPTYLLIPRIFISLYACLVPVVFAWGFPQLQVIRNQIY